jgi:hypothetical protein
MRADHEIRKHEIAPTLTATSFVAGYGGKLVKAVEMDQSLAIHVAVAHAIGPLEIRSEFFGQPNIVPFLEFAYLRR